ncbi:MAG: ATP-dependent RNA helicase RhlB [Gammaproteobacteria bacterium]|nr:ATP-dependent RNA helicase RhlB [Gammaproteobacteria bacterium]
MLRKESINFYSGRSQLALIRHIFKIVRDKLHGVAKFGKSKKPQQLPEAKKQTAPAPNKQRDRQTPPEKKDKWTPAKFQVPPLEGKTRFHDLNLPVGVMHAIADESFEYCTPIQAEAMPRTLAGKDLVGQAQTGTGKTAAFLITIITHLRRNPISGKRPAGTPRALILAPTRELVMQIGKDARVLTKYAHLRVLEVFGGTEYRKQESLLKERIIDIVVATPGRLLDFQQQKVIHLDKVEILVLDEADRMLDMGFIPDVRRIVYCTPPKSKRQTMFFSATFPDSVKRLAEQWTRNSVMVQVDAEQLAADTVEQVVYIVTAEEKYTLLYNLIVQQDLSRVLVFANRRDETRRLSERLRRNRINCAVLSGEVPQNKRIKTLEDFRGGRIRVLVATDVAGRGIHVEGISHVVNYTLPMDPEDYVHRIGRTGRAGVSGISVSFACEEDSFQIPPIEELLGRKLHCIQPEKDLLKPVPAAPDRKPEKKPGEGRRGYRNPHGRTGNRKPRQRKSQPSGT